jgi:aspartyl-tRNA(Asn)/glutamyl-tRNA(Gln) amidotransferase subunit B
VLCDTWREMATTAPAAHAPTISGYEAVIGIEVHAQLRTASKMFCGCATDLRDAAPNTRTCPVCLGMPGVLPVINRRAVELVLSTGLAVDAELASVTRWDRKNYFYPDLPKGYQVSQYDLPLAARGRLAFETSGGPVTIRIRRAHLEEDTARLLHTTDDIGRRVSLVDFNRSGMPLMEIVTEPDIRSAEQARRYAEELRLVLRAIGASDAEMENGQMRVEANVSVRPAGDEAFGTRVEIKNMNSFRAVERAVGAEIERQIRAVEAGETIRQETRGWDDERGVAYVMRVKESSNDYRYFPEPDLPPLRPDPEWVAAIRAALPELPEARRVRYRDALGLSAYDAEVIVNDPAACELFEATLAATPDVAPKAAANWVTGEFLRLAKTAAGAGGVGVTAGGAEIGATGAGGTGAGKASGVELARLLGKVAAGGLSGTNAKQVFARHYETGQMVDTIVQELGLSQISDETALIAAIDAVLAANPAAVADIRAGKGQAAGFLVGQVMKATRGQANAGMVQRLVRERIESGADATGPETGRAATDGAT